MKTLETYLEEFDKEYGDSLLISTTSLKDFLATMYREVREEAFKEGLDTDKLLNNL